MSDLKPCPFCGEKVAILVGGDKIGKYFRVKCWGCGAQTVAKRTRAEAVEAWNCRTDTERRAKEEERVCQLCDCYDKQSCYCNLHSIWVPSDFHCKTWEPKR